MTGPPDDAADAEVSPADDPGHDGRSVDLDARLAAHADDHEVRRRLHDVPPHEVSEVVLDGRRAVCKVASHTRGDPATEGRVQAFVARETPVPAPEVLALGEDYFIAAYRADAPTEDRAVEESDARTMGAGLAWLHEATSFDATGFPRAGATGCGTSLDGELPVESHESWPATVLAFLDDLHDYVGEVRHGEEVEEVADVLRERPGLLDGAGDPVLCHGNWLPDHVGLDPDGTTPAPSRGRSQTAPAPRRGRPHTAPAPRRGRPHTAPAPRRGRPHTAATPRRGRPHTAAGPDRDRAVDGRVTCVLDFEHALVAPAEYDYWRTAMPLSSNHTDGLLAAFRAGYEAVRPLPSGLQRRQPVYRIVNAMQYLESLHLQRNVPREEADRRADELAEQVRETLASLQRRD